MFNLIVISIQDCIDFFLIKCTSFFSSLFFSYLAKRFCTCIRSYLQTKSYFHTYSYTQPVVLIVVVVIVVSMLFSFFDSNKKMKQKRMQKTKLEIGVFSFVAFGALCSYYSKMVELVSWMSFLFTRMNLMKRTHFAPYKKLQQRKK